MRTKETQKKKVHDDEVAPPVFRTLGGKLPSDGGGVPSALHNLASRFIGTTFNFYCAAQCTKGAPTTLAIAQLEQEHFPLVCQTLFLLVADEEPWAQ